MGSTLTGTRVVLVSGKGGVGKTTVAAAIAVGAAADGKRVLLADLEDRESVGPIFGLPRLPHEERPIAPGITGISVIADNAVVEYLNHVYRVPKVSRALLRSKAIEFATQTAPGLRDILLVGTLMEAERRRAEGRQAYDLIVVDAPPTGRLPRLLDAPRAIVELVRGGPIRPQAQRVLDMVSDPARCQVALVTTLEEMPVQETVDGIEALRKHGIALAPVVVNGVWPRLRTLGRHPTDRIRAAAQESGIALEERAIDALAGVAATHAARVRSQGRARTALDAEAPGDRVELPFLFVDRVGRTEVGMLADGLREAGML